MSQYQTVTFKRELSMVPRSCDPNIWAGAEGSKVKDHTEILSLFEVGRRRGKRSKDPRKRKPLTVKGLTKDGKNAGPAALLGGKRTVLFRNRMISDTEPAPQYSITIQRSVFLK